ncbi:hypothetical protein M9H77_35872 [Catharanthus roseus]|uniref:Uncharacterized protein n=1 Tax=Catharanthus roseus TaxID=4058 RepID=A0ACB9ZQ80_CATRO|nr:hypothetical protein M9H77_35872 [Catharanthus roseus]
MLRKPKKKRRLGQDEMLKNTYHIQRLPKKGNMKITCNLCKQQNQNSRTCPLSKGNRSQQKNLYLLSYYKCNSSSRTSRSNCYEPRKCICKFDEKKTGDKKGQTSNFIEATNSIIKRNYDSHQPKTHQHYQHFFLGPAFFLQFINPLY